MLQDTVRTDAYRDFIYGNKHLFAGKTVLDVGCGTGILSMFCAKAGAARVISVDNSSIIEKAKIIIAANGLSDRITCVRGMMEEISLPDGIEKVDIIVSEWMGYCLLFEAMLDSVLYARDKYLKPDGLMIPSHCTLHLASLEDPEFVADNYSFWKDVYGFDMTAMTEKIYDDVIVRFPAKDAICGRNVNDMPFKVLDLHRITLKELEFDKTFKLVLTKPVDQLEGFCVWFDALFLPNRDLAVSDGLLQGKKATGLDAEQQVILTTGPFGTQTHWSTGTCMIDRSTRAATSLKDGDSVEGRISFKRNAFEKRAYNISVTWAAQGTKEAGSQQWYIR